MIKYELIMITNKIIFMSQQLQLTGMALHGNEERIRAIDARLAEIGHERRETTIPDLLIGLQNERVALTNMLATLQVLTPPACSHRLVTMLLFPNHFYFAP